MAFLHDPTFAVLVAFIIFIGLLFKPAKKALTGSLDAKIAKIKSEVDEAQELREEAQATLAAYQRQQRDAIEEVEALLSRAQSEADAHKAEAERALEITLKRQEQQAQEKIAQAEANALREIRDQVGKSLFGRIARSPSGHAPTGTLGLTRRSRSKKPMRMRDPILPHECSQAARFPRSSSGPFDSTHSPE
jgi:F-type H+-transporting ATPase subunit b